MSKTPEWKAWRSMRERCLNPDHAAAKDYCLRGIRICERWSNFENFYADMGLRPGAAYSLERVDNNKNYEPGNCRWATKKEQSRNTRFNRVIEFRGKSMCVAEWAEEIGIGQFIIHGRLRRGWTVQRVLTEPVSAR